MWEAGRNFIFRLDQTTGLFKPFAWNPWPVIALANADGSFRFPDEPRFPFFEIERGPDGKPILRDGLQVWKPNDLRRGMTTVFEAANKVKDAAEDWSGRYIPWGVDGVLNIEPQAFIDEVREGAVRAVLADLALRAVVAQEPGRPRVQHVGRVLRRSDGDVDPAPRSRPRALPPRRPEPQRVERPEPDLRSLRGPLPHGATVSRRRERREGLDHVG